MQLYMLVPVNRHISSSCLVEVFMVIRFLAWIPSSTSILWCILLFHAL